GRRVRSHGANRNGGRARLDLERKPGLRVVADDTPVARRGRSEIAEHEVADGAIAVERHVDVSGEVERVEVRSIVRAVRDRSFPISGNAPIAAGGIDPGSVSRRGARVGVAAGEATDNRRAIASGDAGTGGIEINANRTIANEAVDDDV